MNHSKAVSALCLALCSGTSLAAEPSEDFFLADLPMVLTASRIEQSPLDAPAPVTVIDRETIRVSGFTEIHDLLRLVPGYLVADRPTGSPVVANHAMGSGFPHNLLVLLDGRSVVDPVSGSVEWMDLPVRLDDIERIEVVRGPNQASYGAAAFNGVVNIITRQAGEEVGGEVVGSVGEHDFSDLYARYGRRGETVDWRISLSDRSATPFLDRGTTHSFRNETNDRQTLRMAATWRQSLGREFDFDLGVIRGRDWVGNTVYSAVEPYHTIGTENRFLQLAWRESNGSGVESSLRYYHFDHERQNAFDYTAIPHMSVPLNYDIDTSRDDLEFQQVRTVSDRLTGLWGMGVRHDAVKSDHYFYQMGTVSGTQWQVFGNLDWRFAPAWLLHAGGMVEKHYSTDTLFSPRLALNYALDRSQSLRASIGRGYRAPTMLESDANETYTYLGHPIRLGLLALEPVEPERVDFIEFGYVGRFPETGLQADARVYAEKYDRLILSQACWIGTGTPACDVTLPDGYLPILGPYKAFDYGNTGGARVYGGELALDWRHQAWGRFRLAHAITRVEADANTDDDIPKSAPHHSTSLLWSKELPWSMVASLGYYHVGEMYWLGDGDKQPAYERVDVRLAKRFGRPGADNEIALTVRSLNGKYFEFSSSAGDSYSERQAFITLRLGW